MVWLSRFFSEFSFGLTGALLLSLLPAIASGHGLPRYGNTVGKELLCDAPWRVTTNVIPVQVGIHDAAAIPPAVIDEVKIWEVGANGGEPVIVDTRPGHIGQNTWFNTDRGKDPYFVYSEKLTAPGTETELIVQVIWKEIGIFTNTFEQHFYVRRGSLDSRGKALPSLPGWSPGDVHYHTEYTGERDSEVFNELVEFGGPINFVSWAADAVGLEWVTATDHAIYFDSDFETDWKELGEAVRNASGAALLLRGQESSSWTTDGLPDLTLHTLLYGHEHFINADEFSGMKLGTMIQELALQVGAFSYGAHPYSSLAIPVGDGPTPHLWAKWSVNDYKIAFENETDQMVGLQIWNAESTQTDVEVGGFSFPEKIDPRPLWSHEVSPGFVKQLYKGIVKWDELIMRAITQGNQAGRVPRKIFASAGSDAHGDFNYGVGFKGSFVASDGAIGIPRTYIRIGTGKPTVEGVLRALGSGAAVMTDGPLAVFGVDLDGNGAVDPAEPHIGDSALLKPSSRQTARLRIEWQSTPEFGPVEKLRVIRLRGNLALGRPESILPATNQIGPAESTIDLAVPSFSGIMEIPLARYLPDSGNWFAFRVEAYSHTGEAVDDQPREVSIQFQDSQTRTFTMDDWWGNDASYNGRPYRCLTNPIWLKVGPEVEVKPWLIQAWIGIFVLLIAGISFRRRIGPAS